MVTGVSFRGGETTGGVSDRKIETAKQETTGGVGVRKNNQDSIFTVDNELKQDKVCFRGYGEEQKTSATTKVVGTLLGAAAIFGLLAFAHKYNWASKISDGKFKEYSDKVTEPCHKAAKWIKNNSYDKIVKYFTDKK